MADQPAHDTSSAIWTIPNLISFLRIALIPVFVYLIVHEGTEVAGILLFAVVVSSDWVDGWLARRLGQVSDLGKLLDPMADRLAIAAGLIAFVVRGAFPLWAALLILVRDVVVLAVWLVVLSRKHVRIEVRSLGKIATFGLMLAIPWIAWGSFDLPLAPATTALGWPIFAVAIVEYYVAAGLYMGDLRRVLAGHPQG